MKAIITKFNFIFFVKKNTFIFKIMEKILSTLYWIIYPFTQRFWQIKSMTAQTNNARKISGFGGGGVSPPPTVEVRELSQLWILSIPQPLSPSEESQRPQSLIVSVRFSTRGTARSSSCATLKRKTERFWRSWIKHRYVVRSSLNPYSQGAVPKREREGEGINTSFWNSSNKSTPPT